MTNVGIGYGLNMSSLIRPIKIADVLTNKYEYWIKIANKAIFKNYSREGNGSDLLVDVWLSFNNKANQANHQKGYASDTEEAEKMIAGAILEYSKNAKYVPCLQDLDKIKTAHKEDVTVCSLDAILETKEAVTAVTDTYISADIVFAEKFTSEWDKMRNTDELTINQKLQLIKQLATVYDSCVKQDDRNAIILFMQEYLDLGSDSPDELKDALITLIKY